MYEEIDMLKHKASNASKKISEDISQPKSLIFRKR